MKDFYIQLHKELLNRTDITPATKLVMAYIAARTNIPNWKLSASDIARQLGMSRRGVQKILKEMKSEAANKVHTCCEHSSHPPANQVPKSCEQSSHYNTESTQNNNPEARNQSSETATSPKTEQVSDDDPFAMLDGIQTKTQKNVAAQMDYRNAQAGRFDDGKSALDEFDKMSDPKCSRAN